MTVASAIKRAVLRADGTQINDVFGSSDQIAVEMADLCNEVATEIAKAYDWRALTKVHSYTGDGVQTTFAFPADYDRMIAGSSMADQANWFWTYSPFSSINDWLAFTNGQFGMMTPGGWIIIGKDFNFYPAPSGVAQLPYVSNLLFVSDSGTPKAEADADNDQFVLDERLLTAGLIWRWKAQKGMDYAEDMQTYELELSKLRLQDKGARVIREARRRYMGVGIAYPFALGS